MVVITVVGFTTTYAISYYHHWSCEFESHSYKVYLIQHCVINLSVTNATGRWFSPRPPVSSTYKTELHDITEILLKVALNTIKQTYNKKIYNCMPLSEYLPLCVLPHLLCVLRPSLVMHFLVSLPISVVQLCNLKRKEFPNLFSENRRKSHVLKLISKL